MQHIIILNTVIFHTKWLIVPWLNLKMLGRNEPQQSYCCLTPLSSLQSCFLICSLPPNQPTMVTLSYLLLSSVFPILYSQAFCWSLANEDVIFLYKHVPCLSKHQVTILDFSLSIFRINSFCTISNPSDSLLWPVKWTFSHTQPTHLQDRLRALRYSTILPKAKFHSRSSFHIQYI